MMSIHTVAAGGGSILHFDGARYRVGPGFGRRESGAGLLPPRRPAHRDRRQRDARQDPAEVLSAGFRRRAATSRWTPTSCGAAFAELTQKIKDGRSAEQVAEGFVQIAVGNMANAIKHISVQRGHDVTRYTLCCFGGAAGQHACLVADALAMTRVFIHPLAGVLSAYGMGLADQVAMRSRAVEAPLERLPTRGSGRGARDRGARRARGAGRRARTRSRSRSARTSSTRAPIPRSSCRSARRAEMLRQFESRLPQAVLLPDARPAAGRRGGVGGGDRRAARLSKKKPFPPREKAEPC